MDSSSPHLRSWPPRFRPGVGVGDSKSLSSSQAAELERRFNRSVWGSGGLGGKLGSWEVGPGEVQISEFFFLNIWDIFSKRGGYEWGTGMMGAEPQAQTCAVYMEHSCLNCRPFTIKRMSKGAVVSAGL